MKEDPSLITSNSWIEFKKRSFLESFFSFLFKEKYLRRGGSIVGDGNHLLRGDEGGVINARK